MENSVPQYFIAFMQGNIKTELSVVVLVALS